MKKAARGGRSSCAKERGLAAFPFQVECFKHSYSSIILRTKKPSRGSNIAKFRGEEYHLKQYRKENMPKNELMVRCRKALKLSQRDVGVSIGIKQEPYAQHKVSMWENLLATPSPEEVHRLAKVFNIDASVLAGSFPCRSLFVDPVATIRLLRESGTPALIATCVSLHTRPKLSSQIAGELLPALAENVSLAFFFPYALITHGVEESPCIVAVTSSYYDAWNAMLDFHDKLIARLDKEAVERVAIYRPKRTIKSPANILIPPMEFRLTATYHRQADGILQRSFYDWQQSPTEDRWSGTEADRHDPLTSEMQKNIYEWYFGEIVNQWKATARLTDQDTYWIRHTPGTNSF